MEDKIIVKKKRKGFIEEFDPEKIHVAIRKSADRILISMNEEECKKVSDLVISKIEGHEITVRKLHNIVEVALDEAGFPRVAESYRQYRNYKDDAQKIMEAVDQKTLELSYKDDRSNANAESRLISTKRSIIYAEHQKERYKRMYLNQDELDAVNDGFFYIHDLGARLDTHNCELFNAFRIMKGGFELQGLVYNEPASVSSAIAVLSDLMSVAAGNQYGGLTVPEIDTGLAYYCEKSYNFYVSQYDEINNNWVNKIWRKINKEKYEKARDAYAEERVRRELDQGIQGIEHTFNSVSSCRGDFPSIMWAA